MSIFRYFVLTSVVFLASVSWGQGVTLPDAERVVLENGTVLIVNAKDDVPLVGIELLIRGGAVRDQEGKAGTASLFAGLLERGAGSRSAVEIAEAIESVGGRSRRHPDSWRIPVARPRSRARTAARPRNATVARCR